MRSGEAPRRASVGRAGPGGGQERADRASREAAMAAGRREDRDATRVGPAAERAGSDPEQAAGLPEADPGRGRSRVGRHSNLINPDDTFVIVPYSSRTLHVPRRSVGKSVLAATTGPLPGNHASRRLPLDAIGSSGSADAWTATGPADDRRPASGRTASRRVGRSASGGYRTDRRSRPARSTRSQPGARGVCSRARRPRARSRDHRGPHLPPGGALHDRRSRRAAASCAAGGRRAGRGHRRSASPPRRRLRPGLRGLRRGPDPAPAPGDDRRAAGRRSDRSRPRPPLPGRVPRGPAIPRLVRRVPALPRRRRPRCHRAIRRRPARPERDHRGRRPDGPARRVRGPPPRCPRRDRKPDRRARSWPRRGRPRWLGRRMAPTAPCPTPPASSWPSPLPGRWGPWTAVAWWRQARPSSTSPRRRPCRTSSRCGSGSASRRSTTSWSARSSPRRTGSAADREARRGRPAATSAPGSAAANPCPSSRPSRRRRSRSAKPSWSGCSTGSRASVPKSERPSSR